MTRSQVASRLQALALSLEADLQRAQTRDQHLTLSMRLSEVRQLEADLVAPLPAA